MTRVDVALPLVSREQDGHQLQKHLLQQMEKQWLASWRDASDLASDAASPGPGADARPSAGDGGDRGAAAATASATRAGPNPTVGPDATEPADSNATEQATKPAVAHPHAAASGVRAAAMTGKAAESVASTPSPPMAALASTLVPSTGTAGAAADAGRLPASSVPSAAAPSALGAHALVQRAPAVLTTPPPRLDSQTEELPAPQTGRRSQRLAPPLHSAGPQRLMIRELDADLVQATLRDTQLGPVASQVAAQGLARALMEAGYARVKVVVNGQPAREASDTEGATTSADHPFPTPTASLKDSIHGY